MFTDDELKNTATQVLSYLENEYGLNEAEVFVQSLSQMQGGTEFRTPKVFQSINRTGCAIRFFKDGHLYSSCFSLPNIMAELENLFDSLKYPIKADKFEFPRISMPETTVSNIFDDRIACLDEIEIANLSHSLSEYDENLDDVILDGSILLTLERRVILNSSHNLGFEKGTWCNIDLRALYRGYNLISSAETHLSSRKIPRSLSSIVDSLVSESVQRSSKKAKLDNLLVPVIFSPRAFADIFSYVFVPNLTIENSSLFSNHEFSDNFGLIDDGTVPGLPNSTSFDDEGVCQSKTILFDKGALINSLNNSQYSSNSSELTGNSFRVKMYEVFPRSYQAYPDIFPSNLLIKEGENSFGNIIGDFSEGIFVNSIQGQMSSDSSSGLFKVSAIDSYLIENGSIAGSLAGLDIVGNLYEVLSNAPLFSSDRKVVQPVNTPYSILTPYLITDYVSVIS